MSLLNSFHRRVWLSVLAVAGLVSFAHAQEKFTLAVIPDVQQENMADSDTRFPNRLQWLVDQRQKLNLAWVMQVGDLQNWDTPDHDQYERASRALKILDRANMPYSLCVGNHDTAATKVGGSAAPGNVNLNQRNTSTFNSYYPATRLNVVGQCYEDNKVENSYRTFRAGGLDWLVISLELWARQGPIDWAKKVAAEHPNHNVILLTHAFIDSKGAIQQNNGGYGDKSPQHIFDDMLKPSANARLVFNGHTGTHAYRMEKGDAGNSIYMFNQTYHDKTSNPVRLVEIDPSAKTIKAWVYCPMDGTTRQDGSSMTIENVEWVKAAAK